ncbi:DUF4367 domain-containing protein [Gracilibacillus oryzae]|uniref:DUF4367 domain-containing protein n=1 Tax=Gracilibacillus oryzae TaxID=1672701 RepID=A0A7C8GV92_9BACI|nr:DUF4367 domain-containing protein [Gracilibacillus oryzae]KAB8138940.1 DUF4367 domain-containing protein [Gracilibacillus oryzae]
MKKIAVFLLLALCILIIGCSSQSAIPEGFHHYEKKQVESALDQLQFKPELPQYVPIPAEIVVTDRFVDMQTDQEAFDISMFTIDNDIFTIQIYDTEKAKLTAANEEIQLADNTNAYYSDQPYSKTLTWKKEGITYKLTYRSGEHTLSKSDLIKVAESFQPS